MQNKTILKPKPPAVWLVALTVILKGLNCMETATLQVKFTSTEGSTTKSYEGIKVAATDEECVAFANFLGGLTDEAAVVSVTKVIKRVIEI